jgi:sugar phosphate isomerase/epimerase
VEATEVDGCTGARKVKTTLDRLCIHTITTKPWNLAQAKAAYRAAGVGGITVWRDALEPLGVKESGKLLAGSGLKVVSLCRGGFFPAKTATERQAAIDENRRVIDEAAAIGAPLVVMVCGALPGIPLEESRKQITDALHAIEPHAKAANVRLGIEPLHPMYADTRSAVSTLSQANDMVEQLNSPMIGVTVDVYHLWWDDRLQHEIARAGRRGSIFSFHVCDWRSPTIDLLNDRGLMGEGCIDNRKIRSWVETAGFDGLIEVEVFSNRCWAMDQQEYLDRICAAFLEHV